MEVIDNDLGWNDITKKYAKLDGKTVKAGVLEGAGNYNGGASIAEIATYNHYGTAKIPARPFIAIACDTNKGWQEHIDAEIGKLFDSPANSVDNALHSVGTIMASDIKKVIGSNKLAPNAPATIARKGHAMPLIGLTYKLMSSINHEVE